MSTDIKTIAIAGAAVCALIGFGGWKLYHKGYDDATEHWLLEAATKTAEVQKEVKESNEEIQSDKVARFESLLRERDQRLRELEAKLRARESVESTCDDRDRALRVAVSLEDLAKRALSHLEAERKR